MDKKIKEIVRSYDLNDSIAKPLECELADAWLEWWMKQSSEMSKMLLIKENRIKYLERQLNGRI